MQMIFTVLAVICVVYGIIVLQTNSGTLFFVVWFLLGAMLLLAAYLTGINFWVRIPAAIRIAALLGCGMLFILFIVVESMVVGAFTKKGEPGLDALIVLGAQVRECGPSVVLKYRLDAAALYLEENEETRCIVSGGQGPNEPYPEAEGMKNYLVQCGIDPDRIIEESASVNTAQNFEFSKKLIDPEKDRIGIVTNTFHLFRALGIAEKAGIKNVCGIAAGSNPLFLPNNMLREFFAVCKDFVKGNM
ncbi:MAG: YdcF family protein [Eubacterium sp.]|nr:YdcF family protein [Eubacterium sp.]